VYVDGNKPQIFALLLILGMVLATCSLVVFLVLRYLGRSRELLSAERRAAIEKGLDAPLDLGAPPRRLLWNPLRTAILLLGGGLGIVFLFAGYRQWLIGLGVILIGLANLLYYHLGGKREWEREVVLREELHRAYLRRLSGPPPTAVAVAERESDRL
jgi:hypothetical protein